MDKYYTNERNVQIVIALMKAHGIKKVVVSPGATNVTFVGSIQSDPFFEIYSSVDERSAAYIACGLAAESGEPVALSCTGATASRNYMPGLTEAFYRKLPVLAITASQHFGKIGSYTAQVIDRASIPNDIVRLSVHLPCITPGTEDEWMVEVQANRAMLELRRAGGGPAHINLATSYSKDFSVRELPPVRIIRRVGREDVFPELPKGKVAVFVGAHAAWSEELTQAVDAFCAAHDAVVICDHTSNFRGKYRVLAALVTRQEQYSSANMQVDTLIHIGEVSGAYYNCSGKQVWRVSPDGEIRDVFKKQTYVFEMHEIDFFLHYAQDGQQQKEEYLAACIVEQKRIMEKIPEVPFSNVWIAKNSMERLPENSVLHLGILNSLRAWNLFETPASVRCYANTGGFGIDGSISTLLGASLADPDKLYFGVAGDLAFFYDMNALGNRHLGRNVRILLVNNGRGTEFRLYSHPAERFGDDADAYMAAAGHYGNQSRALVCHYAQDLGFEYLSASTKEEYLEAVERFFMPDMTEKPMLLEVFTSSKDESDALQMIANIEVSAVGGAKKVVKGILGEKGTNQVKKLLGR